MNLVNYTIGLAITCLRAGNDKLYLIIHVNQYEKQSSITMCALFD